MEQQFINSGYETVKNSQKADIYVVNTCSVTNMAERKSRQMLRRVKEINPSSIIVVCGCYAQVGSKYTPNIKEVIMDIKKNKWTYNPNSKSTITISKDKNKNVIILSYEEEKAPVIYKYQDEFKNRLKTPRKVLAQIGSTYIISSIL